jgi:hypothetical protein
MPNTNYIQVDTINDLRAVDDSEFGNLFPCLLGNPPDGWFLINRLSTDNDDGRSVIATSSGNGRWVLMTPQYYSIVADVIKKSAGALS